MRKRVKFFKKVIISLLFILFISTLNINTQPMEPNIKNDPEKVAIVYLDEKLLSFIYETIVESIEDKKAIVKFINEDEKLAAKVGLEKNYYNQWEVQWENIYELQN